MTDANYWRDVQKRMAAGGAYEHGTLDGHLVDPPGPDAWDECGACGHDYDDHQHGGCTGPVMLGLCDCEQFDAATA